MLLRIKFLIIAGWICLLVPAQKDQKLLYSSGTYKVYPDRVVQGNFTAKALSNSHLCSDYISPEAKRYSSTISFKFSINCRDNEMPSGNDHRVTLIPQAGNCITNLIFGKQLIDVNPQKESHNLPENTRWTVRLDMRPVFESFRKNGYYLLFDGQKLVPSDFKGVFIAGSSLPLIWDFNNLYTRPELELKDPDGDGIYEVTLILNKPETEKRTDSEWKLSKDISAFPSYQSPFVLSDAIYKLSTEEMIRAVEPDSTFRTGKEWAGVWTRDISYSIILSMAQLQPKVSKYSLLRKVKNDRIIQDTGTGGAYPASTDRIIWAVAAWELYKVNGDAAWLKQAYRIIKNSIEDDLKNVYDLQTGMVKGESSFLDWREQTYPRWMQPADIFESECLGTNAVHYQANIVLAEMAKLLNEKDVAQKHTEIAERIKAGINKYLWLPEKGYYGQYIYGRNYKIVSPRAEALGEALCVLFGIADKERSRSIIANVPQMNYGISCIYPQIPGIPPYHNNAVWPFVQSYWALASARAGNQQAVLASLAAVYRPAALFLTDKENFVAETGDFAGTQINSGNMLWSLSGSLALVQKLLFGMEYDSQNLKFHPFVPTSFKGVRSLKNFKIRQAVLDIELMGFGNKISRFEVDGKLQNEAFVPLNIRGKHRIRMVLSDNNQPDDKINIQSNYTTVETPMPIQKDSNLVWNKVEGAAKYRILKNGQIIALTEQNSTKICQNSFGEYQVQAVDNQGVCGFASEPIICSKKCLNEKVLPERIELSKTLNRQTEIPVEITKDGTYAIQFGYSNGNGPVNTDNKCAIRSLYVDGNFAGTVILPQRGKNEWSNWGNTNFLQVKLSEGTHTLLLVLETHNENMNGDINQAFINQLRLFNLN